MTTPVFLGPRTLSWRALTALLIVGVLSAAASSPSPGSVALLTWIGMAVLAQIPAAVTYRAAAFIGLDQRRVGVLVTVLIGSTLRAIALAVLITLTGLSDPLTGVERVISASAGFAAWSVLIGAALQAALDYRADLRRLLTRVDRTLEDAAEFTRTWHARLTASAASADQLSRDARELQADIGRRLRPLSHRLWFGMTDRDARHRLLRQMGEYRPPLMWIAAVGFIVFTWNAAYRYGIVTGVASGIVVTAAPVLVLLSANAVAERDATRAVMWRWISFAVAPVASGLTAVAYFRAFDPVGTLVVIVADLAIILAIQTTAVSTRQRRQVLDELQSRVHVIEGERNAVASHLHSTVQSRWNAAALQFQFAAENGDTEQARRALAETRELLAAMNADPGDGHGLHDVAEAWQGIAAVQLDVAPDVPASVSATVSQLVDEAVANAVRHGRARQVSVLVRVVDDGVEVVVTDDGSGVPADAEPGLGSAWRDQVAHWSLINGAVGAQLTALIPLR